MNRETSIGTRVSKGWPRLLLFLGSGAAIFALNGASETNHFVKGYLTLLELQAAFVVVYFLTTRVGKSKNRLLK